LAKIIMVLTIIGAGFFCLQMLPIGQPKVSQAAGQSQVLISEVQITGGAGKTENDFIELFNPNNFSVNLKGYRLVKRSKTGAADSSIKSWSADAFIPPNGYYLWANSNYTDIAATPDATTTATVSDDNGIALRFGPADTGVIIDSLAWGEAQNIFIEGQVFPTNPGANQSLERRLNLDINNNSLDFFIQENSNPQNSLSVTLPPTAQCGNGQVESGEQCDDGNLTNGDGCSSSCQAETDLTPPSPSPGEENNTASSSDAAGSPPLQGGQIQGGRENNFGEVVINELVSDPADNEVEWIELYNKTAREIDLSGWWLEDGSKTRTKLSGSLTSGGPSRFKVAEKPAGNLNNGGEIVILYDPGGKIIDQLVYGNWPDGNLEDNAPAAPDPMSLARKFDGYNTFNNVNDFILTLTPTKGAGNLIQAEDESGVEAKAKFDFSNDIFISEILPNPTGDDAKLEFIEIYNAGARQVDLTGWSLSNEDNKKVNLEKISTSTKIQAGEYLALFRPRTKIVLRNDQGEAKLYQPLADKPVMTVIYKNVKEGWSYNLDNPPNPLYQGGAAQGGKLDGEWQWSETITPGAANVVLAVNHAPIVEFSWQKDILAGRPVIFDSSDTDDLDGDSLKYTWDFGDGFKNSLANPEHTFFKAGLYQVKLAVSDGKEIAEKVKSLKIVAGSSAGGVNAETPLTPLLKGGENGIIINEIFPDPTGADIGQEWAELKNQGSAKINLLNWRLENGNGKYKFKNDLWLEVENFYVLNNTVSKLAFKNSEDIISLYDDLDALADQAEYTQAVQGQAYARGQNGKWFWTTKLTPSAENVISLAGSQSLVVNRAAGAAAEAGDYVETTLAQVKEMELGSLVKARGVVAVEPGILGAQIFYIISSSTDAEASAAKPADAGNSLVAETATLAAALNGGIIAAGQDVAVDKLAGKQAMAGIQIYNYKKDFPTLEVGDYIEVAGELAETQGELRIKTKIKNDISVKAHQTPPPALALNCDQVNEEAVGQLISLAGEITAKKSSAFYLDDGGDEVLVYLKKTAGIETKSLAAGQMVAATGILSKTGTGLRLLPRSNDDIVKINRVNEAADLKPQVLGEADQPAEWAVAERDKKLELFKYLLIIAGGIIIILVGLFIKAAIKKG